MADGVTIYSKMGVLVRDELSGRRHLNHQSFGKRDKRSHCSLASRNCFIIPFDIIIPVRTLRDCSWNDIRHENILFTDR